MIQIEHISKTYGDQVALSDASFSIQKGDIVGLLGVNGAGKSTLMKILAGGILADKGRVTFSGEDILSNPLAVKKRIGYLSEDNPLYEDMYVKEYLEYVAGIYNVGHDSVSRVIEETGLIKMDRTGEGIQEKNKGSFKRKSSTSWYCSGIGS